MHSITPCQRKITDRFPVASFVVNVPPSRLFEIVCTTDPQLLRPEYRGRRTAHNFFTSRTGGLLRAAAGHATYLVPAEQLKRFAGRPRIYFALASYDSPRGDDPKLSIAPDAAQVPSIQLSADFTGRSLDRARIRGGAGGSRYGAPAAVLTWGGDTLAPRTLAGAEPAAQDYDDGFSPDLWKGASQPSAGPSAGPGAGPDAGPSAGLIDRSTASATPTVLAPRAPDPHEPPEPDPSSYEDAGLGEAYGRPIRAAERSPGGPGVARNAPGAPGEPEPAGFEDALALRNAGAAYGRIADAPIVVPHAYGQPVTPMAPAPMAPAYGRPVMARMPSMGSPPVDGAAEPPGAEHHSDLVRSALRAPAPAYAGASPAGEPPGAEDARDLARHLGSAGLGGPGSPAVMPAPYAPVEVALAYGRGDLRIDEPPGAEDARSLGRYGAPDAAPAPATPEPAAPPPTLPAPTTAPAAPAPASGIPGRGVDDGWVEDDDEADLVSTATGGEGQPLTIRKKFEILLPVAAHESGERRYTAVLGSVEHDDPSHAAYQRVHHGLHWGLVLFTQRSGVLGKVLAACERRDSTQFRQAFGATMADRLIHTTTQATPESRLAPVGGALLWSHGWMEKFRDAGRIPAFQAAQNEVAIEHYFDRNLGFAAALGLTTDRALAMVFDRAIHMGLAGGRQWILQAGSPITDDSRRAAALQALGHADVAALQRAAGLAVTGRFGTQTHAALIGALRGLGDRAPFAVPAVADLLDRMVSAAAGRRFEQRIRALRTHTTYTDAVQQVI